MKPMSPAAIAYALASLFSAGAHGADSAPPPARERLAAAAVGQASDEPVVKRTVIADDSAHIEELRVRGQLQKVTVDPKGRAPSYEIIVGDGSRDLSEGGNTSRGAVGKRVWNVFRF